MLSITSNIQQPMAQWTLSVLIYIDKDTSPTGIETVTDADLSDARSQVWFDGCICSGHIEVAMDDLQYQIVPIVLKGTRVTAGFQIRSHNPAGEPIQVEFGVEYLSPVAARGAQTLRDAGLLKEDQTYSYRVIAGRPRPADIGPAETRRIRLTAKSRPLTFLDLPLTRLTGGRKAGGTMADKTRYPVFYTSSAIEQARRVARKGAASDPGVETGAMLAGPLCFCPRTRTVYSVVTHVFEFAESEQTPYSLAPSGETWRRIQEAIRQMQSRPETRHHRALGSCHGHNFPVPQGRKSSVFISQDDRLWSSAVFSRQPYQLCHIFGADSGGHEDEQLYGMEKGRLQERGYRIVCIENLK